MCRLVGHEASKSFKVSGVLCFLVLVCVNDSWFVIYFRYCVDLIFCHVCKVTCVGIQCCSKSDRFFRKPYHKPVIAKILTKIEHGEMDFLEKVVPYDTFVVTLLYLIVIATIIWVFTVLYVKGMVPSLSVLLLGEGSFKR